MIDHKFRTVCESYSEVIDANLICSTPWGKATHGCTTYRKIQHEFFGVDSDSPKREMSELKLTQIQVH